ncbi:MAG TPA: hypothetical protein VIQ62_10125 [Burkholderiales bacterium]
MMKREPFQTLCPGAVRVLSALALLVSAVASPAQELSLLAGAMRESETSEHSYAWALDYRHGLGEHAAVTFSWLNEGHIPNHHRDGQAVQLWGRTSLWDRRLSLAVGAGPYRYYDTTRPAPGDPFSNAHGWAAIYSASATYYAHHRWLYELRVNRILANSSFNTTSMLFGVGYQLDAPQSRGPLTHTASQGHKTTENELTVFVGQTVVNSFGSERDTAWAVEYRRGLSEHVDWTVSVMDEGDTRLVRRDGVVTQLWLAREAFERRFAMGIGLGPYVAISRRSRAEESGLDSDDTRVSAMFTASAALRLSPRVSLRGSWNRVLTDYSRDTDIVLIGLGYRF